MIIIYYTAQCLAVKVVMLKYIITSQEILYYMSIVGAVCFYAYAYKQDLDLLGFPAKLRWVMFWRVLTGSVMDVVLYMAFRYTSYSKALCIFYTNSMMLPFFAHYLIHEPI